MQVVIQDAGQTPSYVIKIVRLSDSESVLSDATLINRYFSVPVFFGGHVLERRKGRRSSNVYAMIKLWKD